MEPCKEHLEAYTKFQRAAYAKLQVVWGDIGYSVDEAEREFEEISRSAQNVWSQAVVRAEGAREEALKDIEEALKDVSRIKQQLGPNDEGDAAELSAAACAHMEQLSQATTASGQQKTLRDFLGDVRNVAEQWRSRKEARMQAYDAVMAAHMSLKQQMGLRHVEGKLDISTANMDFLRLENDKLHAERDRRLERLQEQMRALRTICQALGEDDSDAAADAHPSLRSLQDKESQEVMARVNKLAGTPAHMISKPDLSDDTFRRLERKVKELHELKFEREAQAKNYTDVLSSLWQVLNIPEDAAERTMVRKMVASQYILHTRTLEKFQAEIDRLERCKADAMREFTLAKARELTALCEANHISPPDTAQLLSDMDKKAADGTSNPGQISDVLSKLVRMTSEVNVVAAKRAPVLALIRQLTEARTEVEWLRSYSADTSRFTGRDSQRNIQRSIRAEAAWKKAPAIMETLRRTLAEWQATEGGPFVYDGHDYQTEVLDGVEAEVKEQLAAEQNAKLSKTKDKALAKAHPPPPGGSHAKPPPARAPLPAGPGAAVPKGLPKQPPGGDRPQMTPRTSFAGNRGLHSPSGPASSARIPGVYGGGPRDTTASKLTTSRSNDYAPGELKAVTSSASLYGNAHAAQTPPRGSSQAGAASPAAARTSTSAQAPESATSAAAAQNGSRCRDAIGDKFAKIMSGQHDRSTATGGAASGAPHSPATRSGLKLTFSAAIEEENDTISKRDTPKSTAASRLRVVVPSPTNEPQRDAAKPAAAGVGGAAPGTPKGMAARSPAKQSRIPRPQFG